MDDAVMLDVGDWEEEQQRRGKGGKGGENSIVKQQKA
jgi:hypothetical protein